MSYLESVNIYSPDLTGFAILPVWESRCGDKTILRPFYLHNGISYTSWDEIFILNQDPGTRIRGWGLWPPPPRLQFRNVARKIAGVLGLETPCSLNPAYFPDQATCSICLTAPNHHLSKWKSWSSEAMSVVFHWFHITEQRCHIYYKKICLFQNSSS